MFKYSDSNKRYYTLDYFYKNKFNSKVFKVSLNGGFSCPNFKNGTGCIFCSALGSGDFAGNKNDDLKTQFESVKKKLDKKYIPFYVFFLCAVLVMIIRAVDPGLVIVSAALAYVNLVMYFTIMVEDPFSFHISLQLL